MKISKMPFSGKDIKFDMAITDKLPPSILSGQADVAISLMMCKLLLPHSHRTTCLTNLAKYTWNKNRPELSNSCNCFIYLVSNIFFHSYSYIIIVRYTSLMKRTTLILKLIRIPATSNAHHCVLWVVSPTHDNKLPALK